MSLGTAETELTATDCNFERQYHRRLPNGNGGKISIDTATFLLSPTAK
jgi:hypothetical protein